MTTTNETSLMILAATPVPTLPAHQLLLFLLQVALLLLLALALGRLAVRLGMPAIVGELLTGVLLGPSVLGSAAPGVAGWLLPADPAQMHLLDGVGQLGVLLLVGITGAQLDITMLRRRGSTGMRISLAGLLVPLALGIAAGFVVPAALTPEGTDRGVFALFLGVAMCVSAIPVIAKTLADMNLLHRDIGQLTLAAGMVDDAVGWFLLSVVSAMATAGLRAGAVATSVVCLVGFVLLAYVAGRPLVRWALRAAGRSAESGPTVTVAVIIVILGAATTHALGMEALFGAFVAGVLIGQTVGGGSGLDGGLDAAGRTAEAPRPARRPPDRGRGSPDPVTAPSEPATGLLALGRRRTLQGDLAPLRTIVMSVLAPLFLATAGLRMDLSALTDPKVLLAAVALLIVAVVGKFAGAYLGARSSRLNKWEALALGAGMNARGVVEVVVAMVGLRLGVLTTATYTIVVLIAVVTSLMGPPLLRLAMSRVETTEDEHLRHAALTRWG